MSYWPASRLAAPALACAAALIAGVALAQPAPSPNPSPKPSTGFVVPSVTVQAPAPPRAIRQQSLNFVLKFAGTPNPELDQIARWRNPVCVQVVGQLPDAQAEQIKKRIEDVARAVDIRVLPPGCRSNIQIVFTDKAQATMDVVARRREYLLGYYHRHDRDRLKTVTHPIQAWYVTASESEDPFQGATSLGMTQVFSNYLDVVRGGGVIDDPEQLGPNGCDDAPRIRGCLRSLFNNVFVVADTKALAGRDAGLIADYLVLLTLAQPRSLDGCNSLPSMIDLFGKSACAGRDTPTGLTQGDAAYLTALYKADLETRKNFEQDDIAVRMAQILIKANLPTAR